MSAEDRASGLYRCKMVPAQNQGERAYHRRCVQGVHIKPSGGLCMLALMHEVLGLTNHLQTQPVNLNHESAKASIQQTTFSSPDWEILRRSEQPAPAHRGYPSLSSGRLWLFISPFASLLRSLVGTLC